MPTICTVTVRAFVDALLRGDARVVTPLLPGRTAHPST
jgi:hypothetical protein